MKNTDYRLEYEIFEKPNKNKKDKITPQIWLAFHGIGQNIEAFKHFANQNNFKTYSFGLFYHEKNQDNLINPRETNLHHWIILIQQFLETEFENKEEFINIIGFSLGVRPALQLISNFSKFNLKSILINKIILIAPETLAVSKWYRFGTQTFLGKLLLKKVVSSIFFKDKIILISSLLFSKNAQKLIRYQIYHGINSLASAWLAYSSFEIYGKDWKEISENYEGKITIVVSQNDNFVKFKKIKCFIAKNSFDKGKSIKWIISKSAHARLLKEFKL
ncbi:hypothetical protein ACE193_19065 [Bernardetia sp. OM2101]|uniref:hypothetical protein n=1 Tax=Bernardetia sp. OM2101 TaxID=3344876 RepID=UPI0035D00513